MLNIHTKKVRKKLAEKYNLSLDQVDEIIRSPFAFQKKIMKEEFDPKFNNTPSVRIINFGIFYVPEHIKKRLKNEDI